MSNQCNSCVHKGDIKNCLKTDCSFHDIWIVNYLEAALNLIEKWSTFALGTSCLPDKDTLLKYIKEKCDEVLNETKTS